MHLVSCSFVCNVSLGGKKNKLAKLKSSSASTSSANSDAKPLFLSNPYVTHMLVKGNFKTITELPKYIDINEWLAFNSKYLDETRYIYIYIDC